jgi:hypothetical protein
MHKGPDMIDGLKDMLLFVTDADGEIVGPNGDAITEDDVDDNEDTNGDAAEEDTEDAVHNFTVSVNKLRPGNILKVIIRGINEHPDGGRRYWQLPIDIKLK